MPTSYTSLLGLALPVTGELSGTWGDTVNDYITQYLDGAVAGTQTISGSQVAVTLSKTTASALAQVGSSATGSSQYFVINCTGNPASTLTITAPAASKPYIVINSTSTAQSVKIVGAGPTTGVTIAANDKALVAWNGSDFVRIGASAGGSNTQVQYNNGGNLAGSANLTFDGTTLTAANFADSSLTAGRVTYAGTSGNLTDSGNLTFDGTTLTAANFADSSLTSGRVTYAGASGNLTDSANLTFDGTTLTAANFADSSLTSGRVTYAGASGNLTDSANLTFNGTTLTVNTLGLTNALTVPNGGTGVTSATAYALLTGGTTSTGAFQTVSGTGTSGQVLVSNGAGALPSWQTFTNPAQAGGALIVNTTTVTASYTVPTGSNAFSVGPITVASGQSVTVSSGQRWVVI